MNQNELIKHIRFQMFIYILVIICFLLSLFAILTTPVKAAELKTTVITTGVANTTNCGTKSNGSYCYGQGYTSITWSKANFGSSYGAAVEYLAFDLNGTFPQYSNVPATLQIISNGNSFSNTNYICSWSGSNQPSNCSIVRVSSNQLNVNFRMPLNGYTPQYLYITIGSNSQGSFQGLDGIIISTIKILQTVDDPNASVIENQNQNTDLIVNNNNENTMSIINSQNLIANDNIQTARTQLESMCSNSYSVSLTKGGLISGTSVVSSELGFYSDYINVGLRGNSFTRVCLTNTYQGSTPNQYLIFYDSNKNVLQTNYANNACRNLPSGTTYFRIGTLYPGALVTAGDYCEKAEEQINAYLRDDSNPSVNQNDIEGVISDVQINNPVSYLLTLPVNLVNKINQVFTSGTCSSVNLGHFGFAPDYDFVLPCINFQNYIGSTIWNLVDTIVAAGFIALTFYKIYKSVTNILSLGAEDEISSHLGYLSPMEFLAQIIGSGSWTGGRHNI